jgi:D-glycero-D-manno-heptose 1,7-bisphosphate phosphatase
MSSSDSTSSAMPTDASRPSSTGLGKVIVLDRDGTIVVDRGYLADPCGLEFERGAAAGLKLLYDAGYRLVVITNQSGVGRGMFQIEQVHHMNHRLQAMVAGTGARLSGIYFCPHAPEQQCECRKPAQALMQRAATELNFNPAEAVVIGDKESDVEFGRRAGARTILIRARTDAAEKTRADLVVGDLQTAAHALGRTPR